MAYEILRKTKIFGDKCSICGSKEDLVLHHKDFNHQNNELENMQLLCKSCHIKIHGGSFKNNVEKSIEPRKLKVLAVKVEAEIHDAFIQKAMQQDMTRSELLKKLIVESLRTCREIEEDRLRRIIREELEKK